MSRMKLGGAVLACLLVASGCGTLVTEEQALTQAGERRSSADADAGTEVVGETAGDGAIDGSSGADSGSGGSGGVSGGSGVAGGSGGARAGAAASGTSDQGVTDTEIRIGTTAPLSGLLASLGEQVVGSLDAYFKHVNAQGGINGRKIRLVIFDDRGDAAQILANIRRLYEQEKVLIIIPFLAAGAEDFITRNGIPVLDIGADPTAWSSKYPTIHPVAEHPMAFTQQLTAALKQAGKFKQGMKVGMLVDAAIQQYVPAFKEAWELGGAQVVSIDPLELGQDCTSIVLKMRQMGVEYWDFETVSWISCISAAQRQQWRPSIGWGNWTTSLQFLVDNAGPWTDGLWSGNFVDRIDGRPRSRTKAHEEMERIIGQYRPRLAKPGQIDAPTTMSNWIIAHLVHDALKAQGKVITKAGINDWLHKVENYETGISTPILSMAANCKTGTSTAWFGQWSWQSGEAQIQPRTGYLRSPFEDNYGGKCYLTRSVDKIIG
jgi:ABC-type branched-subunit amino acid transport system substrate-binding protein